MALTLEKSQSTANHLVLLGISWEKFEQIETIFEGIEGVRFVYLDRELEIIMSPSRRHESSKCLISTLLEVYMRQKGIRFYMWGSATIGNKEITGRKEPDQSYNLYSQKDIPDLVIEVIVTSGNVNILEIYRRIGVPEVWFYQDSALTVYTLKEGQYLRVEHSHLLPDLNLDIFAKYVNYPDQYDAVTNFISEL